MIAVTVKDPASMSFTKLLVSGEVRIHLELDEVRVDMTDDLYLELVRTLREFHEGGDI